MPEEIKVQYCQSLEAALRLGQTLLASGAVALEVVEAVVCSLEEDEHFNAGKGAVFTADGRHELDASIMDGATMGCGSVAGVTTVRNPISLARLVMERSGHVMLLGEGAEKFADTLGSSVVKRVPNSFFSTEKRKAQIQAKLEETSNSHTPSNGTVGAVALDIHGHLAAGTSTGGMLGKQFGRVGDSAIIGAGTYANQLLAVSCTGNGEEFMRHGVAKDVAARYEYQKTSLVEAADHVVFHVLRPGDGGLIAVSHRGEIAMPFTSRSMFRGAADYTGRFEVRLFRPEDEAEEGP
eukprot:GGOE01014774.1.p1 GENE.GGOE01014774.1~~GGOE01014774.1.p1  ORF type:complete len:329 (+),score=60.81 GGOE01014774.1:106-987(+)